VIISPCVGLWGFAPLAYIDCERQNVELRFDTRRDGPRKSAPRLSFRLLPVADDVHHAP